MKRTVFSANFVAAVIAATAVAPEARTSDGSGAVDTVTNDVNGNAVFVFDRIADGGLA
jgi:hypothetical protein